MDPCFGKVPTWYWENCLFLRVGEAHWGRGLVLCWSWAVFRVLGFLARILTRTDPSHFMGTLPRLSKDLLRRFFATRDACNLLVNRVMVPRE